MEDKRDDFQARISSGINEDEPLAADNRDSLERRSAEWFDQLKRTEELRQAMAPTPEERQKREELMWRIFDKLGIRTEVEELVQLKEARKRRLEEAQRRYTRTE